MAKHCPSPGRRRQTLALAATLAAGVLGAMAALHAARAGALDVTLVGIARRDSITVFNGAARIACGAA